MVSYMSRFYLLIVDVQYFYSGMFWGVVCIPGGNKMAWCYSRLVTFQVIVMASMKMTAFWDIALCSLELDQHFRAAYFLHHQGDE
jgi:hypothetical protein